MDNQSFFLYILVMSGSTYLIRLIPFVAIEKKIKNKFIKSFLTYIPYAVLTAMTIPAFFFAPDRIEAAIASLICAILISLKTSNLLLVALSASALVFIVESVLK